MPHRNSAVAPEPHRRRPPRRRWSIAALSTAIAALTVVPSALAAPASAPLRLDAYNAHHAANTPPVVSHAPLRRGVLYVATAQGTVSFYAALDYVDPQSPFTRVCGTPLAAPLFASAGGSGEVGEDPQFIFAHPAVGSCSGPPLPHAWSNFQADLGAGWAHPQIVARGPVARPTRDHRYDYALVGRGLPVRFRLLDPDTRDDYGALEISVRRADSSDCAGAGYQAFGVSSAARCRSLATGPQPAPARPVRRLTVNESPLLHVLRNRDVPSATNQQLPSGALGPRQFAGVVSRDRSAAGVFDAGGFTAGAISAYRGGGLPALTSTAVRYRSGAAALAGLRSQLRLARAQVPAGAIASSATSVDGITVVTYTPRVPSGTGGDALLLHTGRFVEGLIATESPDRVSLPAQETLLRTATAAGRGTSAAPPSIAHGPGGVARAG